jgi:ferredoxin
MAKIPVVDKNTCIGCGSCVALCPKVFRLGSDGKAEVYKPNGDTESNIQKAIDACPVGAIKWKK